MKCLICLETKCACLFDTKHSDNTGLCKKCAQKPLDFELALEQQYLEQQYLEQQRPEPQPPKIPTP